LAAIEEEYSEIYCANMSELGKIIVHYEEK
jgi:hypothetical protein